MPTAWLELPFIATSGNTLELAEPLLPGRLERAIRLGGGAGSLRRTRLRVEFPDNPQFTGKMRKITGNPPPRVGYFHTFSASYGRIPYPVEQGI